MFEALKVLAILIILIFLLLGFIILSVFIIFPTLIVPEGGILGSILSFIFIILALFMIYGIKKFVLEFREEKFVVYRGRQRRRTKQ